MCVCVCRFNFLDFSEYTDDNDDGELKQPPELKDPPSDITITSDEMSPVHATTVSNKYLNLPVQRFGKEKGHSPLLYSHRTNSESFLASPQARDLHGTKLGVNRSLSSSYSGLTNGLSAKERGHTRTKSNESGWESHNDSGLSHTLMSETIKRNGGLLSSSSLPPDGLRRLMGQDEQASLKKDQLSVSYQEAA